MKGKWCSRCGQLARLGTQDWMCAQCLYFFNVPDAPGPEFLAKLEAAKKQDRVNHTEALGSGSI